MKPLLILAVLAVASTLPAAPAHADYRACMEFCTKEHDFVECNNMCRVTPSPGPAEAKPIEICNLTDEEQREIISEWFFKNYDIDFIRGDLTPGDNQLVELEFRPPNKECKGVVRLTADCKVVRHKKFNCKYTGWTRKMEERRRRHEELQEWVIPKAQAAVFKHVRSKFPDSVIRLGDIHLTSHDYNWDSVPPILAMNWTQKRRGSSTQCRLTAWVHTNNYRVEEKDGWTKCKNR